MANSFFTLVDLSLGRLAKTSEINSNFQKIAAAFDGFFPGDKKDFRKGTTTFVGETTGTASAYIATPRNAIAVEGAEESGAEVVFSPHAANEKGATLAYAGGGARLLVDAAGTPLNPNELSVDLIYVARLNTAGVGTWQLQGTVISNPAVSGGSGWTVASVAPASPNEGDGWYDTGADQLKTYDGAAWVIVGVFKGVFTGYYSHNDSPFEADENGRVRGFDGATPEDSASTDWTIIDKLQLSKLSSNAAFSDEGSDLSGNFDGIETGGIILLSVAAGEVAYRVTAAATAQTNGTEIPVEYVYEYGTGINLSDDLTVKINPRRELAYTYGWTRGSTAPADPLVGQGWYDSTSEELQIWSGTAWKDATDSGEFDLHEDITSELTAPAGADRLVASDESVTGQPNKYLTLTKLKEWLEGVFRTATKNAAGAIQIATAAIVETGTNDTYAITSARLRVQVGNRVTTGERTATSGGGLRRFYTTDIREMVKAHVTTYIAQIVTALEALSGTAQLSYSALKGAPSVGRTSRSTRWGAMGSGRTMTDNIQHSSYR